MANITKKILVQDVAKMTGKPKTVTREIWEAFAATITSYLANGDKVNVDGFGTFLVEEVPEKTRRNPQTGEPIICPPHVVPKFRYGKDVKDAVNGR